MVNTGFSYKPKYVCQLQQLIKEVSNENWIVQYNSREYLVKNYTRYVYFWVLTNYKGETPEDFINTHTYRSHKGNLIYTRNGIQNEWQIASEVLKTKLAKGSTQC